MKLTIALFFCLISFYGQSQLTIFGGPQQVSADYKINDITQPTEYKTGFMAGVSLRSFLEGPIYFAPHLYYSQKGYKVVFNQQAYPPDSGAINNNTTIHTIELAPLVQINFSKKASYLFLRFGPAFDANISGKEIFDSVGNKRVERKMPFSFFQYGFVTVSGIAHLGYQHQSGLTIFGHYNYGLASLNNADFGPKIFHRIYGITAGWKFGKKK